MVFPQRGKLTGFSWLVFLSLGEFLVNKYNRVFICGRCYLVSNFCSSCFKEKYHPFALTNFKKKKKKDEKIFSAQIIAKSTWRSKLLNSQTAGEPRIGIILSLLTSEPHVCDQSRLCHSDLKQPWCHTRSFISWLNRLSGLKLASHHEKQDSTGKLAEASAAIWDKYRFCFS